MDRDIRWQDATGTGLEHCRIDRDGDGVRVEALVISPQEEGFGARYRLICDARWHIMRAEIAVIGTAQQLVLASNGAGRWTDGNGMPLPALDGAIDIDISATPFTNTLPIRRLGLEIGEAAEIAVVYVDMPSMAVSRRPQRYARLGDMLYRFETLDHDFKADVTVDGEGVVIDYPGLFRRVGEG